MDRDRRLCELMGMCWHDGGIMVGSCSAYYEGPVDYECEKCGEVYSSDKSDHPDFTLPEWRARLMDWAVEQEWWGDFLWSKWSEWAPTVKNVTRGDFVAYLWRNLPDLLAEYHGEGRE